MSKKGSILSNHVKKLKKSSAKELVSELTGTSEAQKSLSRMKDEASKVVDAGDKLGGSTTTGSSNLVASSLSVVDNPYSAWIAVTLSDDNGESIVLHQSDGFISMEHTRLMGDKGAKLILKWIDKSGGCELESTILKHPNIKIQYGFHNGSVSPVWAHKIIKMMPSLVDGFSSIELEAISLDVYSNSTASGEYGGSTNGSTINITGTNRLANDCGASTHVTLTAESQGSVRGSNDPTTTKQAQAFTAGATGRTTQLTGDRHQKFKQMVQIAASMGDRNPVVTAAQWATESGWGSHVSGKNNYFGVKDFSGNGTMKLTTEHGKGKVMQPFKNYDTIEEGIAGHIKLKMTSKNYKGYATANTIQEGINSLGSYATDPGYRDYLANLIRKEGYDLNAPANTSGSANYLVPTGGSEGLPSGTPAMMDPTKPSEDLSDSVIGQLASDTSPGTIISDIVKQIANEEGWKIKYVEPTIPIKDHRGLAKTFNRASMSAREFIEYQLAPLAVSAKSGAGGYITKIEAVAASNTAVGANADLELTFAPLIYKSTNPSEDKIKYIYDVRTPVGAIANKVISFAPQFNALPVLGDEIASTANDSTGNTDTSRATTDNAVESIEKNKVRSGAPTTNLITPSSSSIENAAKTQSIRDLTYNGQFRAELVVLGNPGIKVLDLLDVNYIMQNGDLHYCSGGYTVVGVVDSIVNGEYTTVVQLVRGTSREAIEAFLSAESGITGGSGDQASYVTPSGGYQVNCAAAGMPDFHGGDAAASLALNAFLSAGMNLMCACHGVANIYVESGGNPQCSTTERWEYGRVTEPAVGIFQWHSDRRYGFPRKDPIHGGNYMEPAANGKYKSLSVNIPSNPSDLVGQIQYAIAEMQSYGGARGLKGWAIKTKQSCTSHEAHETWHDFIGYARGAAGGESKRMNIGNKLFELVKTQSPVQPSSSINQSSSTNGTNDASTAVVSGSIISSRSGQPIQFEASSDDSNRTKVILTLPASKIVYPVVSTKGYRITSKWGYRKVTNGSNPHRGMDLAGNTGDRIVSIMPGVVAEVVTSNSGMGGRYVKVNYGSGHAWSYVHLSKCLVNVGDRVAAGQVIGLCGGSGRGSDNAYPSHLHVTPWYNGVKYNPEALFTSMCQDTSSSGRFGGFKILN